MGTMSDEEFTDLRRGVRNELGTDSSSGPMARSRKSRDAPRSGKSRAASFFGENQTPRVHKAAPRLLKNNSIEFGVQARMTPLKDCTDEAPHAYRAPASRSELEHPSHILPKHAPSPYANS